MRPDFGDVMVSRAFNLSAVRKGAEICQSVKLHWSNGCADENMDSSALPSKFDEASWREQGPTGFQEVAISE